MRRISAVRRHASAAGAIVCVLLLAPGAAGAQSALGVGGRIALLREDTRVDAAATRLSGAFLRAALSRHTAIELSLDYRSRLREDLGERTREMPFQGSLLLYPWVSGLSPYLLAGLGWYTERVETLEDQTVVATRQERTFGYHAGVGGQLRLGRRAAVHLDYRYTFVEFGAEDAEAREPGALPLPGLRGMQERLNLTHLGAMWTTGLTVYF